MVWAGKPMVEVLWPSERQILGDVEVNVNRM